MTSNQPEAGAKRKRFGRLRYGLRTLLIAMTLAAFWVGWQAKRVRDQERVIAEIEALGGNVTFVQERNKQSSPSAPGWLLALVGEEWFREVHSVDLQSKFELKDEQVPDLSVLKRVEWVNFDDTQIGDETLAVIARLPKLRHLYLMDTNITDEGLKSLSNCQSLAFLTLGATEVSEEGLDHLHGLQNLRVVAFEYTNVREVPQWMLQREGLRVTKNAVQSKQ